MSVEIMNKIKDFFTIHKEILRYDVTVSDAASHEAYVRIVPVYKNIETGDQSSSLKKPLNTSKLKGIFSVPQKQEDPLVIDHDKLKSVGCETISKVKKNDKWVYELTYRNGNKRYLTEQTILSMGYAKRRGEK